MSSPLTPLELALFHRCLRDAVEVEFSPRTEVAVVTGNPNMPGD